MASEHFDVLIVGAGLSGIGAGYHLQHEMSRARASSSSRAATASAAPGICSAIPASAPTATCSRSAIRSSHGPSRRRSPTARASSTMSARPRPRTASTGKSAFNHRVKRASWSSQDARWTVEAERSGGRGRNARSCASPAISCSCAPAITNTRTATRRNLPARKDFAGRIVHPQKWPDDLDYAGKRVVVIGSGATAVTLVPEMAKTAGARHHAAALADLCGVAPGAGSARQQIAAQSAGEARLSSDPLAQRAVGDVFLPALPAQARRASSN